MLKRLKNVKAKEKCQSYRKKLKIQKKVKATEKCY